MIERRYASRQYDIPPPSPEMYATLAIFGAIVKELPRKSRARIIKRLREEGANLEVARIRGDGLNKIRTQASDLVYVTSDTFAAALLDEEAS